MEFLACQCSNAKKKFRIFEKLSFSKKTVHWLIMNFPEGVKQKLSKIKNEFECGDKPKLTIRFGIYRVSTPIERKNIFFLE